jgi:hypothetical protein
MPLARYFLGVGGVLLALILFFNAYLPKPVESAPTSDAVRPVVRIRSAEKLPERIVIDTSIPTIVPPTAVAQIPAMQVRSGQASSIQAAPIQVSSSSQVRAKQPVLDARAQAAPSDPRPNDLKKAEFRVAPRKKIARHPVGSPMMAYAQAPRYDFDFFAHN